MIHSTTNTIRIPALTIIAFIVLTGCGGGTKLIKEPQALQIDHPIAEACDDRICAYVDWVIVRNGPGSWAKNATWDEYLLRVNNRSGQTIQVEKIVVVDSLGIPQAMGDNPSRLKRSSSSTIKRYRDQDLTVKAGDGTAGMLAAGGGAVAAGFGVGVAVGGYGGLAIAAAAPAGLLVLGPALVVNRMIRGSNIEDKMQARESSLPGSIAPGSNQALDVFVPFAPSPKYVQIDYSEAGVHHKLRVDTRVALGGLHFGGGQ